MIPTQRPAAKQARATIIRLILLLSALCLPRAAGAQTYTIAPNPFGTVLDNSGRIVVAGCVWTYAAGTTTPITTYADNAGTANANPIIADFAGRFTAYLLAGTNYKFVYENIPCSSISHGSTLRTADNIAGTPGAAATVDITATAGEAISAGQCVYWSDGSGGKATGQVYKCDAANTYSSTTNEVGIATAAIASTAQGNVRIAGSVTGLSSLSVGAEYFVGTAGALTSSAPANKRHLGHADSATTLVLTGNPSTNFLQIAPTMTNGQLIIGSTGVAPVAAALTAGNGISTTTGAGTLTVTNTGGRAIDTQTPFITSGCVASGTGGCVSNSTNEVTIYTFSVAGGTLSTNKTLHLSLFGDHLINNGGADSVRLKVKFGATTICDGTVAVVNFGANRGSVQLTAEVMAAGGTSAQRAWCTFQIGDSTQNNAAGTMASVSGTNTYTMYGGHNAVAEDSTASKALVVTATLGTANAAIDLRAHTVVTDVR